jgi:hypothetical protein
VLSYDTGNAWEDSNLGNCFVWVEGTNDWKMIYEAKGTYWAFGLATSSDGETWTKYGSNPVFSDGSMNPGRASLARIESTILKHDGKYYMYFHEGIGGALLMYRAYSTDLTSWTEEGQIEGIRKTPASIVSHGDGHIAQFQGKTYMWYCPSNQVDASHVNVIIDNLTLAEMLALDPATCLKSSRFTQNPIEKWTVDSGELATIINMVGSGDQMHTTDAMSVANYAFKSKVKIKGTGNTGYIGCMARFVDASNYYYFQINAYADELHLYKVVADVHTQLHSSAETINDDTYYTLELCLHGTTLKLYLDGVLKTTETDSAHTASGKVGTRCGSNTADYLKYDNFMVRKYVSPEPSHSTWGNEEEGFNVAKFDTYVPFYLENKRQSKRINFSNIQIPNRATPVTHLGSADVHTIRVTGRIKLGSNEDTDDYEDGFTNVQWHTSTDAWRGEELFFYKTSDGTATSRGTYHLVDYQIDESGGRKDWYPIRLNLVKHED